MADLLFLNLNLLCYIQNNNNNDDDDDDDDDDNLILTIYLCVLYQWIRCQLSQIGQYSPLKLVYFAACAHLMIKNVWWLNKSNPCFYSTDVQPPRFLTCPFQQTVYAQKGKTTATVSWALVKATDNDMFPITPQLRPNVKSPNEFAEGSHTVIYTATDQSRNKAFCYFRVTVRGKTTYP